MALTKFRLALNHFFTEFYLIGFTIEFMVGFIRIFRIPTGFYWVLPSFGGHETSSTGFCWP